MSVVSLHQFMITLRIKYAYNRFLASPIYQILINNYFLLAMMVLICGLSFIYPMMWVGALIFEITLWRRYKTFGIISLIICVVFLGSYIINEWIQIEPSMPFNGIIIDEEQTTTHQKLLIQSDNTKLIVYSTAEESFRIGDKVYIIGELGEPTTPHLPGGFDYARYLKLHHIAGTIKTDKVTKTDHPWSIWWFKDALNRYLEHCFPEQARAHIKGLLFGDRSGFSEEFSDSLSDNGLVHLFAVSGLHIGLIIGMISWLFRKLKWKYVNTFLIVLLAIYMIVTAFAPSIVRAILMFYLTLANKRYKWQLSSLDVISIVFIGLMLINPYYLFDIGFCLSFLVATMIIMLSPHLQSYKNWQQVLIISFASQWLTLPLIINFRHEFNVLSFAGSIVFIYLVSYIILPMALVTFCCSFLSKFYEWMMEGFTLLSTFCSEWIFLPYQAPSFTFLSLILYYGAWYGLIIFWKRKSYRWLCSIVIIGVLLILSFSVKFNPQGKVVYLDLNEGESTVIVSPYGRCKAIIDTGVGRNHELTNYLLQVGIHTLDVVFITHNHDDHDGELDYLRRHIIVRKLVVSPYYPLTIDGYQANMNEEFVCGDLMFTILGPLQDYGNPNDNSLVIKAVINHKVFLWMGDASITVEQTFPTFSVDVVKIAHHGSATSSSLAFLMKIKPKIAIIQVGQVNRFDFPSEKVVERLQSLGTKTYVTTKSYTITYLYQGTKGIWSTLKNTP